MKKSIQVNRLLLFGGTGAIGMAILEYFKTEGWAVTLVSRRDNDNSDSICWNPLDESDVIGRNAIIASSPFDAVCWAQGANLNDSIYIFDSKAHIELYHTNVIYIIASLNLLLTSNALKKPSRLCIISSIWQNMARQEKLSYCITKAALQGLVLSTSNDLGRDGHLVNAVLPGVIDTPMTHKFLSHNQIAKITNDTQFGRLPSLFDVASAVYCLCSERNTGITGQFVKIDLGYSNVRVI
jgi:NAD(P)-dependent dehydrogenase (short-subunit alcohol dehydrogenase family)